MINRVSSLAILVINSVWFVRSCLDDWVGFSEEVELLQKLCLGQLCQPQRLQFLGGEVINRVWKTIGFGHK